MKTVDGAPQFDQYEIRVKTKGSDVVRILPVDGINNRLREWAKARTCVNCEKYLEKSLSNRICTLLGFNFHSIDLRPEENVFSCISFREKR